MQQVKAALRKELIEKRRELDSGLKAVNDRKIFERVANLPQFKNAETVLCYVSTAIEVDTDEIIRYCLISGKKVAVPQCVGQNMVFRFITGREQLKKGAFGISEPDESLPSANSFENSICIVPALRYNTEGQRIGYGKGFYDRFLRDSGCFSIGICYDDFIGNFPAEKHDKAVDIVVTERRIYEPKSTE